ncbi:MAG: alpha-galactosidase [Spirochaetes bacterium]|nr:alpha-galactosidase [Spirochaetota bacterium]
MGTASAKNGTVDFATAPAPALPWDQGRPVINGPDVYGASPGKEFLYLIPAIGERPMRFTAENLPAGLAVDSVRGQIQGRAVVPGEYAVTLHAENSLGTSAKIFTIIIGEHKLALTPPMGWNSWNCFRSDIDDARIRAVAESMVSTGLAARGYSYVNMDSGWQSKQRGGPYNSIVPKDGFPDMAALCSHIHALGLKVGIYSAPYTVPWGTDGCGTTSGLMDTRFRMFNQNKFIGIEKHEDDDVCQWAAWGFDYCKYDWNYTDMVNAERMSRALRDAPRDMVFSITTDVEFSDAFRVKELANLWRSNKDMGPLWELFLHNGINNTGQWNPVIGPGHWFDLCLTAFMPRDGKSFTRNELIAHISCWMMRPSPIMIDCDTALMRDNFVLSLLCNEEIIAVNQDRWGKPAASIYRDDSWDIQIKPLSDGNYALAYFNLGTQPAIAPELESAAKLGIHRTSPVRDLWRKEDLGVFDFPVGVDAHCAKVYKVYMV